ncbi:MAG: hypothetical protein KAT79_01795 [candidate division Zixibacteria bacterium]|nr:hypothetical protein [candidate division Zixibacteria bacterium]
MNETAAIFISRQAMHPSGESVWVQKTVEAVRWVASSGRTLVTSHGMPTWELQLSLASDMNIPMVIYVLAETEDRLREQSAFLQDQFSLKAERTEFRRVAPTVDQTEELRPVRDRAVVKAADLLIPVAIREGGNLRSLLEVARKTGKELKLSFQTEHSQRDRPLSYNLEDSQLSSELASIGNDYIIHWTRAANSAWPGEKLIDYYRAIISSDSYPRSAMATLHCMLDRRLIVASSRHMPRDIATVSFSSLAPAEVIPLMKWRARYRQMSFEPYGIGIDRECALASGIMQVRYTKKGERLPADIDPWLTQSAGAITDWRTEKEYRHRGDFDFGDITSDRLIVFAHRPEEAALLQRKYGIRAVTFLR